MAGTETSPLDQAQREKAREILHILVNALSAAKLFPSDHQTVVNFIFDLHDRLNGYLNEHWKLELEIEEQAFAMDGEKIFTDPHPMRSLPFFFFKDGMQKLYFYKGLTRDELKEFLETMRTVSQLPPEEGDIVTALWEKDFANIRYLAPDDFLETRIGVGRPALRPRIDREVLGQGRIELTAEDLEDMKARRIALSNREQSGMESLAADGDLNIGTPSEDGGMNELESLLKSSRQLSPEDEYLNLVVELIYLEDQPDQFPAIVDVLEQYHQDIVSKKSFAKAARLMRSLSEIRDRLAQDDKRKAELIDSAISLLTRKSVLIDLKASFNAGSISDLDGLFAYLRMFGPEAAPFLADIYEQVRNPEWRAEALEMLKKIGRDDIQKLAAFIQESKPALSQEIIRLFQESQDSRFVPLLAKIVSFGNPAVKLSAIRALGGMAEEAANKILLGFLPDPEEDVRVSALDNLKKTEDKPLLSYIIAVINEKNFSRKSAREKRAFFDFLARTDSQEACDFLRGILAKVPFLPNPKHTEFCLLSVSALAGMKRPDSLDILKEASKRRSLKIRTACLKALRSRSEGSVPIINRAPR